MSDKTQTRDRRVNRSTVQLAIWTFVWVATLALASFGPRFIWDYNPTVSWITIVVNVLAGLVWIIAHFNYLRQVDDLQRKIMLEAIAIALGVGLVGGFAVAAAKNIGLISFDSEIAIVSVVMGVVYLVATAIGTVRYR